jgi:pilus assembly protein CpaF
MTPPETQAQQKEPQATTTSFGRKGTATLFAAKKPAAAAARPVVIAPFPAADYGADLPKPRDPGSLEVSNVNTPAAVSPAVAIQEQDDRSTLSPHLQNCLEVIWKSLRQTLDVRHMARLSKEETAAEIQMAVAQISDYHQFNIGPKESALLSRIVIDEMLGFGPIEPLLAREDVSEIMVNGPSIVYIEVNGLIERSSVKFRDNDQLVAVCQRIASQVGRRVDESGPICDARLHDGSRVNIILPPLALDGAALTIRKFKKEKLTIDKLLEYGSLDRISAEMLKIIAACRVNIIVSGGTGSGKTTLLNCLTRYIHSGERIVTCEDSAELQLQQPHVVRLETRPPNLEGVGEVTMRDLVRNCLRMRPERIIVGEVRGQEAFDLLQAMNTGHDGSMGTVHANTPRDALGRIESMVSMNRLNLPPQLVRQQISSAVNVIVQVQRLQDGSRKVMSISEITGMESEVIMMQDLMTFEIKGEGENGKVIGAFRPSGLRPKFRDKLAQFGLEQKYHDLMESYYMKQP